MKFIVVFYLILFIFWYYFIYLFSDDMCAPSIVIRKLSNEMLSKTSSYDATERLMNEIGKNALKFEKSRTDVEMPAFTSCEVFGAGKPGLKTDPDFYITFYTDFPIVFVNGTKTTDINKNPNLPDGVEVDDSYYNEFEEDYLEDVMYDAIMSFKDLLPMILGSTGGGVGAWIVLGINQVIVGI